MALKTFVQVSGVNNLSDARYCAGMGVDMIGFNVDPNDEKSISPENFKEITAWLSGVEFVAEIKKGNTETLKNHLESFNINSLQVESLEQLSLLRNYGAPLILKIVLTGDDGPEGLKATLSKYKEDVLFFNIVLENGVPEEYLLTNVLELSSNFPIVLGFGINEENVNEIIEKSAIKGISLQGGDEIRPGYKDFDDLANILEAIEVDG